MFIMWGDEAVVKTIIFHPHVAPRVSIEESISVQESQFACANASLSAVGVAELVQNGADIPLYGTRCEDEFLGNLTIGEAIRDERQDFACAKRLKQQIAGSFGRVT